MADPLHLLGVCRCLLGLLTLLASTYSSSALTLQFLELGSDPSAISGSLPRGQPSNSNPIPLPSPLPFSNDTESLAFVSANGFISFRTVRDYSAPDQLFSYSSPYTHIIAPYWTHNDITDQGDVNYEIHTNGSSLLDTVNSAISDEVGVAFEGAWLLVVHWNEVPAAADISQRSTFQAVLVTDGNSTYAIFLYECGQLHSPSGAIGYSAAGNFFDNHPLSLETGSSEVACAGDSQWHSLLYPVHYDGVRAMILPTPEDPVYRAAVYIDLHCKVVTPGNYFFNWEAYCLEGGSERLVFHGSNFSDISHLVSVSSTPDTCLDVIVCRAWDDRGSSGEARFTTGNITGVGMLHRINTMANNTALEADSAHQLGTVSCHSASTQPHIGRWVTPSGEDISLAGNQIFQTRFHTGTFHSYTTISLRPGAEFTNEAQGVYRCIIPDENGVEQTIHFGLYPNGYSTVFPERPLSIRRLSSHPLTLTCHTTHLPPYRLHWWHNNTIVTKEHTHTSLLDGHASSFQNTLSVAPSNALPGTTYRCGVGMQIQPFYEEEEPSVSFRYREYRTYAALQEVGNHWRLNCTSNITNTSAVTWETAEGSEVSRSTGGDVVFTEPVEDSQHEKELICHVWVGERKIQILDVTLLLVHVPGVPVRVSVRADSAHPSLGQPLLLTCLANKTLPGLTNHTTASWSHDLSDDVTVTQGNQEYGSDQLTYRNLEFAELRTSHAGVYVCVGELETVAADLPLVARVEYNLILAIPMATVVLTPPPNEPFYVGSSITLTCTATLPRHVDTEVTGVVAWETPRGMIQEDSERFRLSSERVGSHTHQFTLLITALSLSEDEGDYCCSVIFQTAGDGSPSLSPSQTASSNKIILSIHETKVITMPTVTPTASPPMTDKVKDRDDGGVVGATVAIGVVVIVVVAVAIAVSYFGLRRKANRQIYNMEQVYATYEQPPPPYTSTPHTLTNGTTHTYHHTQIHLHGNDDLYSVVGNGNCLHSVVGNGSVPPPLPPARNSQVVPDPISPYADSGTYSKVGPCSHDDSDPEDDKGQSPHRMETANPLYASTENLEPQF